MADLDDTAYKLLPPSTSVSAQQSLVYQTSYGYELTAVPDLMFVNGLKHSSHESQNVKIEILHLVLDIYTPSYP